MEKRGFLGKMVCVVVSPESFWLNMHQHAQILETSRETPKDQGKEGHRASRNPVPLFAKDLKKLSFFGTNNFLA